MENCIFCKIINKEIPSSIIYEDEDFFAFLDINPVTKGHTLLLTKQHHTWIQDVPDTNLGEAFVCSKKIILAIKKATNCDYVQVVVEGKDVPHFHIHLIPSKNETKNAEWIQTPYEENEKSDYLEKIKSAL